MSFREFLRESAKEKKRIKVIIEKHLSDYLKHFSHDDNSEGWEVSGENPAGKLVNKLARLNGLTGISKGWGQKANGLTGWSFRGEEGSDLAGMVVSVEADNNSIRRVNIKYNPYN